MYIFRSYILFISFLYISTLLRYQTETQKKEAREVSRLHVKEEQSQAKHGVGKAGTFLISCLFIDLFVIYFRF